MSMIIGVGTARGVHLLSSPRTASEPWKVVSQGLNSREVTCLTGTSDGVLLAGTAPGSLYRTRDFESWEPLYSGLSQPAVHAVAVDPINPRIVYCGTSPAALFGSADGGHSFIPLPALQQLPSASAWTSSTPPYRSRLQKLMLHPAKPSVVVAAVRTGGLYVSADSGSSWHDRSQGCNRDVVDFQIHAGEPSRIYVATSVGFFRSDDLGSSWNSLNQGLGSVVTGPVAVAQEEPSAVFLAVHKSKDGGPYLFRSPNGGQNWSICPGSLPYSPERRFTALAAARGHLFLGSNQGELWATTNFGESWALLRSQLPPIHCLSVVYQS